MISGKGKLRRKDKKEREGEGFRGGGEEAKETGREGEKERK